MFPSFVALSRVSIIRLVTLSCMRPLSPDLFWPFNLKRAQTHVSLDRLRRAISRREAALLSADGWQRPAVARGFVRRHFRKRPRQSGACGGSRRVHFGRGVVKDCQVCVRSLCELVFFVCRAVFFAHRSACIGVPSFFFSICAFMWLLTVKSLTDHLHMPRAASIGRLAHARPKQNPHFLQPQGLLCHQVIFR